MQELSIGEAIAGIKRAAAAVPFVQLSAATDEPLRLSDAAE